MKKSKSKKKKKGGSRGGAKVGRQFSINSGMAHDSNTASAMAIAGAFASGQEGSTDLFVLLSINNARNLQPMNSNGQSDPYCVIRYLNVEHKTRTHKNTLNPDFGQHFFFKAPTTTDVDNAREAADNVRAFCIAERLGSVPCSWGVIATSVSSCSHCVLFAFLVLVGGIFIHESTRNHNLCH